MATKRKKPTYRLEKQDVNGFGLITQCHGNPPDPELVRAQWGPGEYRVRELNPETQRWRHHDSFIIGGDLTEPENPNRNASHEVSRALLQRLETTTAQLAQLHGSQGVLQHRFDSLSVDILERLDALEHAVANRSSPEQQMREAFTMVKTMREYFGAAAKNSPDTKAGSAGLWDHLIEAGERLISSGLLSSPAPQLGAASTSSRATQRAPHPQPRPDSQADPRRHYSRQQAPLPPEGWAQPPLYAAGSQHSLGQQHSHHSPWEHEGSAYPWARQARPHPPHPSWTAASQSCSQPVPESHSSTPEGQQPPPIPRDPHPIQEDNTLYEGADLQLHPTLPGMTPAIEEELLRYSDALGIPWEQGIARAKANNLDAPQLLALAKSQVPNLGSERNAAH